MRRREERGLFFCSRISSSSRATRGRASLMSPSSTSRAIIAAREVTPSLAKCGGDECTRSANLCSARRRWPCGDGPWPPSGRFPAREGPKPPSTRQFGKPHQQIAHASNLGVEDNFLALSFAPVSTQWAAYLINQEWRTP